MLASLGGASSCRGSCETSVSMDTEASIGVMKEPLAEAEEKYRRAMVSNAQLHNEKTMLMFQVDTLREELSDLEELLWETRRSCEHANKELERERQTHRHLQAQFTEMKETCERTEELLMKHGVFISSEIATNSDSERSEDGVITESASRLAEEPPQDDGEGMLGETPELQPVEGSEHQDHFQPNHQRVSKPTNEQTRQTREKQNTTNKNLGTSKIINQVSEHCSKMKEPFDRLVVNQEQGLQSAEETAVSMACVSDLQSSETQEKPEGVYPSLPERSETSGIFHDLRIHEPVRAEACPECPESKRSVPEDMWTSLEKTVQEMLQGLANKPGFVVEISRIFSEILVSLHRWTLDLENTLKHSTRNEPSPCDGPESLHHGFLREPNVTDKTLQPEAEGSGHSAWIRASSASVGMTEPTDSRSNAGLAVEDHHVGEEITSIEQDTASSLEDTSKTSPGEQTDALMNMSEEVVFIDSHFAEPVPTRSESRSEQGLRDSSSTKPESHLGKDPKDLRSRTLSSSSNAGQSSAVKRLIEATAEELRAIAVPELDLWSLQEGKLLEETKAGPLEEVSVGDMDSCEEADEEEEEDDDDNVLQPASEQELIPNLIQEDSTQNPEEEPEDVPLDQRKEDCRVS